MTKLTFGVSASSFAANMAMKQNMIDHHKEYPQAVKAVLEPFYVDDTLSGVNSIRDAIELQGQLQELFDTGGFTLWRWKSSKTEVTKHIPPQLLTNQITQQIKCDNPFTQVLGIRHQTHFVLYYPTLPHFRALPSLH